MTDRSEEKLNKRKTRMRASLLAELEAYIEAHYVMPESRAEMAEEKADFAFAYAEETRKSGKSARSLLGGFFRAEKNSTAAEADFDRVEESAEDFCQFSESPKVEFDYEKHESALDERIKHLSDTFSEYLIYLIDSKGLSYADVYRNALVDRKTFSKLKNNPGAHPKKMTAMCLCMGAQLNLDQTRDLLARAGYALSPCDKTDIIFSFFIENKIYDMIELDIQLEAHGLDCLIS